MAAAAAEKIERVGVGMTIRRSALAPFSSAFFHVRFHLAGRQYLPGDPGRSIPQPIPSPLHSSPPPTLFFLRAIHPLCPALSFFRARNHRERAQDTHFQPSKETCIPILSSFPVPSISPRFRSRARSVCQKTGRNGANTETPWTVCFLSFPFLSFFFFLLLVCTSKLAHTYARAYVHAAFKSFTRAVRGINVESGRHRLSRRGIKRETRMA